MSRPKTETIVDYDSPEAAKLVTVKMWQSSRGHLFSREDAARYNSCTHRPCQKCGARAGKYYTLCNGCRDVQEVERFLARPVVEWDGNPVWSDAFSEWFLSPEDAIDRHYEDNDDTPTEERLLLLASTPVYARELTPDDFADDLSDDDDDFPEWLAAAIDTFNAATKGKVLSWGVGRSRVDLTPYLKAEAKEPEQ